MKTTTKLNLVILPLLITGVKATALPVVTVSSGEKIPFEVSQVADTLETVLRNRPNEEGKQEDVPSTEETMEKSPLFSMLRSTVVPGWGQFYTGHPYRGILFFTLEGILFTFAWAENYQADRNWEIYEARGEPRYLNEYDQHFNRGRDLMSYAIAGFLINIADAYVGAHLYDFEGKVTFEEEQQFSLSMNWHY